MWTTPTIFNHCGCVRLTTARFPQADKAAHDAQMTQLLALQHARANAKWVFSGFPRCCCTYVVPRSARRSDPRGLCAGWRTGRDQPNLMVSGSTLSPMPSEFFAPTLSCPEIRPSWWAMACAEGPTFCRPVKTRLSWPQLPLPRLSDCALSLCRYQDSLDFHGDKVAQYHMPDTGVPRKMAGGD